MVAASRFRRYLVAGVVATWLAAGMVAVRAVPAAAGTTPHTYTVDTTADGPDTNTTDGVCADTNLDSGTQCTLRAAIMQADAEPGSTVVVPAGTYPLTIAPTGSDDVSSGDLNITADMTITGAGAASTIVDGGGSGGLGDRIFEVDPSVTATMSGLTIQGGHLSQQATGTGDGGGILSQGTLRLSNSVVTSNFAGNIGGGIDQVGDNTASATLTNVTVTNNGSAVAGGIAQGTVDGDPNSQMGSAANVTVTNSTVSDNGALSYGGGIVEVGGATVTITGSTISGNVADQPALVSPRTKTLNSKGTASVGGVAEHGFSPGHIVITQSTVTGNQADLDAGGVMEDSGGTVDVTDSTVSDNVANGGWGGGFFFGGGGTATLVRVDIAGNEALYNAGSARGGGGGGIEEDSGDVVHLTDSIVENNKADSSGAGAELSGGSPDVAFSGTTVSGNVTGKVSSGFPSDGLGGGVASDFGDVLAIANSTITGNQAVAGGGGVAVVAPLQAGQPRHRNPRKAAPRASVSGPSTTVTSATIDANTSTTGGTQVASGDAGNPLTLKGTVVAGAASVCSGTVGSGGYNYSTDASCALAGTGDTVGPDPKLGALAANGGPTPTQLPQSGSPVVDVIPSASCPTTVDQRGVTRPQGKGCDVGAVETFARSNLGYRTVATDGGVFDFGKAAEFRGSLADFHLNAPIVGMANVSNAPGYLLAGADGGVFALGGATYAGSLVGRTLSAPIVGVAVTPTGNGYILVGRDGTLYSFGDAPSLTRPVALSSKPNVVGIAITPTGKGAWIATADGGVFTAGDAAFYGSAGALRLNAPIVAITATPDGSGYWLAGRDGGVFVYGDAVFQGSMGGIKLNSPVVGIASTPLGKGYWEVASDGGVFAFGDAAFAGSMAGTKLNGPMVGIAAA